MIAWWTFWRGWEKFDVVVPLPWFGLVRCNLVEEGRLVAIRLFLNHEHVYVFLPCDM